jgi:hypothetical protein
MHRFYYCPQVQMAWSLTIVRQLQHNGNDPIRPFSFEQCIFRRDVQFRLNLVKKLWHLLRGITLWTFWLAKNATVYERLRWPESLA